MNELPLFFDADEAIEFYDSKVQCAQGQCTDAEKAHVVASLSKEGLTNREIREALKINHVYTVTHLKRAGVSLSDVELTMWHQNPGRITLGHVRAIANLPQHKREKLLRELLARRIPVRKFESIAKGDSGEEGQDADIERYERMMGETLGRQVKIDFNKTKHSGAITLDFFSLDDLDRIAKALGFDPEEEI